MFFDGCEGESVQSNVNRQSDFVPEVIGYGKDLRGRGGSGNGGGRLDARVSGSCDCIA